MKRSLTPMTLAWSLVCFLALASCERDEIEPGPTPPSQLILGKWSIVAAIGSYTEYGDNRKDTTYFTTADYLDFKADSTLSIESEGKSYAGKWWIDNNKLFITGTNYVDYSKGWEVLTLDQQDLKLYRTENVPDHLLEQKLNLTR